MTSQERSGFDNGIWLCQSCSKLIDSDSVHFTTTLLKTWKKTAEELAFAELSSSTPINAYDEDKKLIAFYLQCFDRPAFQYPIEQEGSMEDFQQAIEDTIIALNTGVQTTRDGKILKSFDGISMIHNNLWREKLITIVDMLVSINHRLAIAKADDVFYSNEYGMYCFNDRQIAEWFDKTRGEILKILFSICEEVGIKNTLHFPRERYKW
ncbi:HNH endonuclease [Enterococcus faecalis]|nr:HNH endonuclease [Enterococcus faecalis]